MSKVVQEPNFFYYTWSSRFSLGYHIPLIFKSKSRHQCRCRYDGTPSIISVQEDIDLLIQISQEIIDLTVFTISLKIETRKLESNPCQHIA